MLKILFLLVVWVIPANDYLKRGGEELIEKAIAKKKEYQRLKRQEPILETEIRSLRAEVLKLKKENEELRRNLSANEKQKEALKLTINNFTTEVDQTIITFNKLKKHMDKREYDYSILSDLHKKTKATLEDVEEKLKMTEAVTKVFKDSLETVEKKLKISDRENRNLIEALENIFLVSCHKLGSPPIPEVGLVYSGSLTSGYLKRFRNKLRSKNICVPDKADLLINLDNQLDAQKSLYELHRKVPIFDSFRTNKSSKVGN